MSRTYTLHDAVIAKCPICCGVSNIAGKEGSNIDLGQHDRANNRGELLAIILGGTKGECPGSGMTVKLTSVTPNEKQTVEVPKDTDQFPFGKYCHLPYKDVPADYLDWLAGQQWIRKFPKVVAYINANRENIDKDLEAEGKI